jgi:hypothetical protein
MPRSHSAAFLTLLQLQTFPKLFIHTDKHYTTLFAMYTSMAAVPDSERMNKVGCAHEATLTP